MTGMITRTAAKDFEKRLDEIVKRYRPTHRITVVKRKDFFSYEEAEQYCKNHNISTEKIYKIN